MIRVFIADDHQILLDGLTILMNDQDDIILSGTAASGEEALKALRDTPSDVTQH